MTQKDKDPLAMFRLMLTPHPLVKAHFEVEWENLGREDQRLAKQRKEARQKKE